MKPEICNNQIFSRSFLSLSPISTSLSIMFVSGLGLNSVLAHNVKTNVDVGVTFHIEPDHSPQTGQENQAWFALTRKGGELIPLAQCDCELNVYLESERNSREEPLFTPDLISLSPEKYQNIPGANLTFSKPGIYQLELTGKPKETGDFMPFQVSYPVTVKASLSGLEGSQTKSSESSQVVDQNSTVVVEQVAQSNPKLSDSEKAIKPNLSIIIFLLIGVLAVSIGLISIWKKFSENR